MGPDLFGFDGVACDGVEAFAGRPQVITWQTGAQSPAIPALQRHLWLQHVADETGDATGTGGAEFMPWLAAVRDETVAQLR